eukprot:scaffold1170_cov174-Amphora_coffeaeformis.AAC.39
MGDGTMVVLVVWYHTKLYTGEDNRIGRPDVVRIREREKENASPRRKNDDTLRVRTTIYCSTIHHTSTIFGWYHTIQYTRTQYLASNCIPLISYVAIEVGMVSSSNSTISLFTAGAAGIAAVSAVALTLLQSDAASRRILPVGQLAAKRRVEYNYRWTQALEKAKLQVQFFLSGGVNESSADEALLRTTILTEESEMQELVDKILSKKDPTDVRVVRLGKDAQRSSTEFFLWLISTRSHEVYQLPLTQFTTLLGRAFERQIMSSAFCFVSDASASAASRTVVGLVRASKTAVHVVEEPLWMASLAAILEHNLLSASTAETVLFSLCRMEAQTSSKSPTLLITLPGQASTALLLPLLQKVFPDDRHVFSYTGCVRTVQYAAQLRKSHPRAKVPKSVDEALKFDNPVSVTTPIYRTLYKSANVMKSFLGSLASLPIEVADTVETWMGAVDAFLELKEEDKVNGYLPYVFKLDYIQNGSLEKEKKAYWCVVSLLQFVTGSRTRAKDLTEQQIDAAISWLKDQPTKLCSLDHQRKAVEETVFNHKRILLENKTLLDTVQPTQHWTLKQAVKAGCACCAPDEDEDPEDMGALTEKLAAFKNGSKKPVNGGYVDGKTAFAFDPTRFST